VSNYLAIATVTATLAQILSSGASGVSNAVSGAVVTFLRPDKVEANAPSGGVGVNIYLYKVDTNPFFRNADLPTRRADGSAAQLPQVALDLSYLFSFYGDDGKLEPQLLLGWTEAVLHQQPILTAAAIESAKQAYPFLKDSTLASQINRVTSAPLSLTLEDLSKIWSVFLHAPYLVSVAYQMTVILVTPDTPAPLPALPVRERKLRLFPFYEPTIDSVIPQEIEPQGQLAINGRNFRSDEVEIVFPGTSKHVTPNTSTQITLTLPDTLRAGINSVMVVTEYNVGSAADSDMRPLFKSNVAAFVLRPKIVAIQATSLTPPTEITARVMPAIGADQEVTLWLEEVTEPDKTPRVYGLPAMKRDRAVDELVFAANAVAPGTYLARLRVDHAESILDKDIRVVIE
jgi:hypothetical protein